MKEVAYLPQAFEQLLIPLPDGVRKRDTDARRVRLPVVPERALAVIRYIRVPDRLVYIIGLWPPPPPIALLSVLGARRADVLLRDAAPPIAREARREERGRAQAACGAVVSRGERRERSVERAEEARDRCFSCAGLRWGRGQGEGDETLRALGDKDE